MHNAIVNSGTNIGENCILNTNSLIEHDVNIGNYCHISTGAIINGGVIKWFFCWKWMYNKRRIENRK